MKNYSYIGISLVILVFGIWAVPKVVEKFKDPEMAVIGKVPDFEFTNQENQTISNKNYEGKVYVAEFFFTTCPTICPKMNENMVDVQDEFYGNPNFGIASFTITPEIDTPVVLKKYADKIGVTHRNWHMLTGKREAIYDLANKGFNLYVNQNKDIEGHFEHSGYFALVDQEGNIRSRYDKYGNAIGFYDGLEKKEIEMLKEDIKKLL